MFRRQPDGVEIYFNWPSKTGRVVPNPSVKSQIQRRDSIGFLLFGFMGLIATLSKDHSIITTLLMVVPFLAWFVERRRYLSTLQQVPLHITAAQIDKAWIQDVGVSGGIMLTAVGALTTLALAWLAFAQNDENSVPMILLAPMILASSAVLYAGIRILWAKFQRSG